MVKAVVSGAAGRMGSLIIQAILDTEGIELAGALEAPGHKASGKDAGSVAGVGALGVEISCDLEKIIDKADVIIEFTTPEATEQTISVARKYQTSMVIGTTAYLKRWFRRSGDWPNQCL